MPENNHDRDDEGQARRRSPHQAHRRGNPRRSICARSPTTRPSRRSTRPGSTIIVIIFPDQKLSQEDLIRVTGYFGEQGMPRRPPKFFPKGYAKILPGIMLISNIRENGEPIGALPGRRDDVPPRHDPFRDAGQGDAALLGGDPVAPAATRCSPAAMPPTTRSIRRSATSSKAAWPSTTTITARCRRATARAPKPSANASIRRSAPTRTPTARRSMSTA